MKTKVFCAAALLFAAASVFAQNSSDDLSKNNVSGSGSIKSFSEMMAEPEPEPAKKYPIKSYTEIFLGPGESNTFRTGASYRGFYVFGQVDEFEKDYTFSGGALYDGRIKNTSYRILGSYGKEFYGFVCLFQDFGISKVFNPQPTLLVDSKSTVNIGVFLPFKMSKNLSGGLWWMKDMYNKNTGFDPKAVCLEVDVYITF